MFGLVLLAGCPRSGLPPAPPPGPTAEARSDVALEDIRDAPPVTDADRALADVFRPLDGDWIGTFKIYVDTRGQQSGPRPMDVDFAELQKAPYRLENEIQVRQRYVSESPYFQRVTIDDTYDGKTVTSRGANKVQGGRLVCVVLKPDDTVVHTGELVEPATIVWRRDRPSPLAIEYFKETVTPTEYSIVGWGYYGSDDPKLAPPRFFHAVYRRP